jgi:hypothetical protein
MVNRQDRAVYVAANYSIGQVPAHYHIYMMLIFILRG